jgi:two-component system chemotaxis sensor kinase CheA
MSIDNEILQEFLIEAGELFDQLNDQFVALESNSDDIELINAIFRAYHTIKGGAGFMKLTPMVEICHRAEDIINQLRQGERKVTNELIDIMFQVLDELDDMFTCVRSGEVLPAASQKLLKSLDDVLQLNDSSDEVIDNPVEKDSVINEEENIVSKMDDEFEEMLSVSSGDNSKKSDLITDDEFDAVLDSLHGEGKHGVLSSDAKKIIGSEPDLITDDEFEKALDEIHGKGKGPGASIHPIPNNETKEKLDDNNKESSKSATVTKIDKNQQEATVRVDTSRLDDIMNLVGELVLVRNRLTNLKSDITNPNVIEGISTLELVTSELQTSVMKTRMQPIKKIFNRFPRVIRELARQLNKDIDLELIGEETDLDKSLVEALADPLIHLVRNSADHGIESPEDRFASGKPRQGKVTLKAQQEGDQVLLTITDDGKGMDHSILRQIAIDKGMMSEEAANKISKKEAYNLIFAPGFSTKETISDVSGRGVGMDVVKTRINELNGNVEIDSELGKGTVITITLPLTLAILPTLMVKLKQYQFALPLSNVYEAFNMRSDQINVIDGQHVIRVRDKPLPLFYLNPWLIQHESFDGPNDSQKVIVVQMGNQRFCLVVDHIEGQEEVVIKPLGTMLSNTQGFSGATITGDGSIALIIDVPSLMDEYAANSAVC